MSDRLRVGVVGAGIGGLALATALGRSERFDVVVFERRLESSRWLDGYTLHLHPVGLRALHECVDADTWAAFGHDSWVSGGDFRFLDADGSVLTVIDAEMMAGRDDSGDHAHRWVSRPRLRQLLLDAAAGTGVSILDRHEYVGHRRLEGARVEVEFADDTRETVDLLIGADGADSHVRRDRLPGVERVDIGVLDIAGRCHVDRADTRPGLADLLSGAGFVIGPQGRALFYSAFVGGADTREDHVSWALIGRRESYPDGIEAMSGEQLRGYAVDALGAWDRRFGDLVRASDTRSVSTVRQQSLARVPEWTTSTVTLIGDAAHATTPMAGIGANVALRDAATLAAALADPGPTTLEEGVGAYEGLMRVYANDAIARSLSYAARATKLSPLSLMGLKAALRVSRFIPPVKRAMIPADVL